MTHMLITNARILTMDDNLPGAEAVLTSGERIVFTGSTEETLKAARGRFGEDIEAAGVTLMNAKGKTLIPGFNDDHVHLLAAGDFHSSPNLAVISCEQVIPFLKAHYTNAKPGELLSGSGWDYTTCRMPHKDILDRSFPENPVVLFQYSGHGAWVNSLVLKQLKITRSTPDPEGGMIIRDESGEPTGILRETAAVPLQIMRQKKMNFDGATRRRLLDQALKLFRENGITSVQDNTWVPITVSEYKRYRRRGNLSLRISCWSLGIMPALAAWMDVTPFPGAMVRRGPRKYFLDGTFSTKTAWLMEPYSGGEGDHSGGMNAGMAAISQRRLEAIIAETALRRRQTAFHAIGDRAVHELVTAAAREAERRPRIRNLRLRIEHAQLVSREDLPLIRELGMVMSVQPAALVSPEKDRALLGEERARQAYPYRSILDAGIPLAFGSDIPGESTVNPLRIIENTVNRDSPERITAVEAIRAYTMGSAYAEFMEKEKGSITPGKLADMTLLSDDPSAVPADRIHDIKVLMTITGGKVVYKSEGPW
ncbi:MAG: amidohydrolase [Spirochaetales bacterium]|nr:MAG: amidohydrolase [Spirochaetales bacterium]